MAVGFTAIDFGLNAEGIRSSKNDSEMQQYVYKIILARLLLSILAVIALNILVDTAFPWRLFLGSKVSLLAWQLSHHFPGSLYLWQLVVSI